MSDESQPAHPLPFDVPTVEEMSALLPQYEFRKLAAFGGMGAVYRAQQASLDRPVAVKILPPAFGKEPEFADRFKTEARAMAKLNHSNIVTVYDFGITREGHFYLVMEWVEGHTLHELIQKGSLPLRKTASYVMQLCDALHFAHSHKILHRDVKPGNVMVNEDDRVKVADFGLARPMTGEAEENPFGTPDYAAPEIMDKRGVDQRADIFAAGVVLYELLTGRVPGTTKRSVTEFSPVGKRWDEIIAKATDPDPDKRYPDALEFRAHIAAALTITSTPAVTATEVAPKASEVLAQKPKKALPFPKIGIAAAALILLVVIVVLVPKGEPPKVAEPEKPAPMVVEPEPAPKPPTAEVTPAPAKPKTSEPEKKPAPAPEKPKAIAKAPAPAPAMPVVKTTPSPPPAPKPAELLARLESDDPELTQMIVGLGAEWDASPDANPAATRKELATKYIPALQRALPGTPVEQRDAILSEISFVANNQPLHPAEETWPANLKQLRQAYEGQLGAIAAKANAAAQELAKAHHAALLEVARARSAKGDATGSKRAELVAELILKLPARPSLDAIKDAGGKM